MATRGSARSAAKGSRPVTVDQLPDPLPPLVLLVGDEELLVSRAVGAVTSVLRRIEPGLEVSERTGGEIEGQELHELLGPSLFGEARLVTVRAAQDVRNAAFAVLGPYLADPAEGTHLVLQHAGGAKGKNVLEAARKAGALEIPCGKLTRPREREDFVRAEVRAAGGRIAPDAVSALETVVVAVTRTSR